VRTKGHTNFTDFDERYWDFTFYEMALHDTTAFVDYILDYTQKPKLSYIGHSQGTIVFFVASSVL